MLIGFTGKMGAGKTTAAGMLTPNILSFAEPLKKAAKILFLLTDDQLYTTEGKARIDPRWGMTPRQILQHLGTNLMRAWIPGFWEKLMMEQLAQIDYKNQVVAIDDCRFPQEADLIRSLGGQVVHVLGRSTMFATEEEANHESEQGLTMHWGDSVVNNSGTMGDLKRQIRVIRNDFYA
jgi:thymidine kinase